jgi:hypothetical protein
MFVNPYSVRGYPTERSSDYSSANFKWFVRQEMRLKAARIGLCQLIQRQKANTGLVSRCGEQAVFWGQLTIIPAPI